jgi:hypothetical protein
MYILRKILFLLLLSVCSVKLYSSTATATVDTDADIKLLVSVKESVGTSVDFGIIYVEANTSGTVTLSPSGSIAATGNIHLGGGHKVAEFTFSGDSGSTVNITLQSTPLQKVNGSGTLNASYVASVSSLALDGSGAGVARVGGNLTISPNTAIGLYSGNLTLTANY